MQRVAKGRRSMISRTEYPRPLLCGRDEAEASSRVKKLLQYGNQTQKFRVDLVEECRCESSRGRLPMIAREFIFLNSPPSSGQIMFLRGSVRSKPAVTREQSGGT